MRSLGSIFSGEIGSAVCFGLEQLPISAKLGIVLRNTRLDHRNFFCWI